MEKFVIIRKQNQKYSMLVLVWFQTNLEKLLKSHPYRQQRDTYDEKEFGRDSIYSNASINSLVQICNRSSCLIEIHNSWSKNIKLIPKLVSHLIRRVLQRKYQICR